MLKFQEEVSVMKKKRSKKVVGWHVTLDNMSGKGSNQYKNLVCLGDQDWYPWSMAYEE